MPEALATGQVWSPSRGVNLMNLTQYPGVMISDTFSGNNGAWFGAGASGAGTGLIVYPNTNFGNSDANSLKVQAQPNSRFLAVRKFDITPKKKLAFNGFFCYDNPSNVAFVHMQMQWRDVDHGLTHLAAYRYNTALTRWEYLPNTSPSASGAFVALPNGTTTLASGAGAWHETYFDVDFGNNLYDEFLSGQIGVVNTGSASLGPAIPTPAENTEAQRVEILLGVETTSSGVGNTWWDDITIFEVD